MEIHQLRYFCAVARTGSFTKAADQEGVTQPSLSQQIGRLEKSVGAPLFVRLGRSVRLTHAGEVFLPNAMEILNLSKTAAAQVRHLEEGVRGPLRVGVIPTILPYLLAPHLSDFVRQYPEVELALTEDITVHLVEMLQGGDLDVVIATLPLRYPNVVCSEIMKDPLVLVAPKGHSLTSRTIASTFDLSGERLLLLKEGHCFREDMLTACRRITAEMSPAFEADHFGTIFPLVASGAGVTIAPMLAAAHALNCSVVPLAKPQFRRVGYARLMSSTKFKPLQAFTKWLRTVAATMTVEVSPKAFPYATHSSGSLYPRGSAR
jgi:LysR family hydrogen peroxide-inducible transcriptional activator